MDFEEIKNIQDNNYFDVFSRYNICLTHGKGCKLYDTEGKQYTDFLAGIAVNCLGYGDESITKAIGEQAKKLMHTSNLFYNEEQAKLIKTLTDNTGFDKVFLCNSGAEANEAAIKLARKYFYEKNINKFKIICALNSFHGRTITTATATGQPKYSAPYAPLTPGFVHIPFNDVQALKIALEDEKVAAVMLETIQGEGGVMPASESFMKAARELTQSKGLLLIVDEVQTGIMRCGKLFSFMNYGIKPDIITLAKALGGGFPIGAMLAVGEVAKAFKKGDHGSTFGGNPLACACANATLKKINNATFADEVIFKGKYLKQLLSKLYKYKFVEKVRGEGLLIGLPLKEEVSGKEIVVKMLEKRFIINCAGHNTLRFVPPLIISTREIEDMVNALDSVLSQYNKQEN